MAINSANQSIIEEDLIITPTIDFEIFTVPHTNARYFKIEVPKETTFSIHYRAKIATQPNSIDKADLLHQTPFIEMDHDILAYISPSRHCESDKLISFASDLFGALPNSFSKAQAIEKWVFENVTYTASSTSSSVSSLDTLQNKFGACKDFAHLAIALCRALDIPARYFAGYASHLSPPDFHACFEAYVNGHWIIFDPTRLAPLHGIVKISHGKDASDSPVATYYGNILCTQMDVYCSPLSDDFTIAPSKELDPRVISYS